MSRRDLLVASATWAMATAMAGATSACIASAPIRHRGDRPFGFEELRDEAAKLAEQPFRAPKPPAPQVVAGIDFDTVQKISFRRNRALWPDGPGLFPVRLFHLDKFNSLPVRINVVSPEGVRHVAYSADAFDYGGTGIERRLPADLGYAGFRVMDGPGKETDWLAFNGATYFRSSGEDHQYGASARGIAVDTGLQVAEEFPRFVEFWLMEPDGGESTVTILALLDGPSLSGAYQFEASKEGGMVMDVRTELFLRADVTRLGIAPLTSMYWYGENERRYATDWRPEIHDSDGLALWTGAGEHVWRPLVNSTSVRTNTFFDINPRGFGLMQRDRDFANYQDDGAFYNRRPSIWVEPIGNWGEGAVQLVEIPTRDEIHDNIVAYWLPKEPVRAGNHLAYSYRLYWQNDEPHPPTNVGRVVATRVGEGGIPGQSRPQDRNKRKFVIDFAGGPLAAMAQRYDVTPVVAVSRGEVDNDYVIKVVGTEKWRAFFDLLAEGDEPIDMRCYLRLDGQTLTETWLYQYLPAGGAGPA